MLLPAWVPWVQRVASSFGREAALRGGSTCPSRPHVAAHCIIRLVILIDTHPSWRAAGMHCWTALTASARSASLSRSRCEPAAAVPCPRTRSCLREVVSVSLCSGPPVVPDLRCMWSSTSKTKEEKHCSTLDEHAKPQDPPSVKHCTYHCIEVGGHGAASGRGRRAKAIHRPECRPCGKASQSA